MNRGWRHWWLRAGLCAVVFAAALAGLSWKLLQMEHDQLEQRHQQRTLLEPLRLALWRMDSWLAPQLALEWHRPPYEYQAYFSGQQIYNKFLQTLRPEDVLAPSPLLTQKSEFIRLHFQIDSKGGFSSPQVPRGNQADLAQGTLVTFEEVERNRNLLETIEALLDPPAARHRLDQLETLVTTSALEPAQALAQTPEVAQQLAQSQSEYAKRSNIVNAPAQAQTANLEDLAASRAPAPEEAQSGPLKAVWFEGQAQPELCFLRRVQIGPRRMIQGFLADWEALAKLLLAQVDDLFPEASLLPLIDATQMDNVMHRLAGLPARLVVPSTSSSESPFATPTGIMLVVLWIAALLMLLSGAQTLRASIAFAEQRSRFAASVTHELRTPLTTLQMYSEMLADGLIQDEHKRQEFQLTIKHEAVRLANLVENVLSYSRLEEGRYQIDTQQISCRQLIDSAQVGLECRAESAGLRLEIDLGQAASALLMINSDVMVQVLSNLVDNACKYATGSEAVRLSASIREDRLRLTVADSGPGIPSRDRERLFQPFERGLDQSGSAQGGVGLGLALSRELTREMGGDLILEASQGPGCSFVVLLPLAMPAQTNSET